MATTPKPRKASEIPFFWDGERYVRFGGLDFGPPYYYCLDFGKLGCSLELSNKISNAMLDVNGAASVSLFTPQLMRAEGDAQTIDELKKVAMIINTHLAPRLRGFHVDGIMMCKDLRRKKGTRVYFT